jgi:hypothetical protein
MLNGRKRKGEGGEMGCFIKGKIQGLSFFYLLHLAGIAFLIWKVVK